MCEQRGTDGGSVALLKPDGTPYPGSPFTGGGLPGPWAAVVEGDDNVLRPPPVARLWNSAASAPRLARPA
jgi:hypothetical protein